jgi:aryl-alcohol dehydrogenase-like predicted oxidoreductase
VRYLGLSEASSPTLRRAVEVHPIAVLQSEWSLWSRDIELVEQVEALAGDKGCTPAQLALAWVLAQGGDVVPIPGTRSRARLAENADATDIALTSDELSTIDEVIPRDMAAGDRYPEASMAFINV